MRLRVALLHGPLLAVAVAQQVEEWHRDGWRVTMFFHNEGERERFEEVLAVAAGAVTHADLFFEKPVKLPFLNIELPLLAFFFMAPILFGLLAGERAGMVGIGTGLLCGLLYLPVMLALAGNFTVPASMALDLMRLAGSCTVI